MGGGHFGVRPQERSRRAGKRLRVAVQLTDAELENVLWSDRFEIGIDELTRLAGDFPDIIRNVS